MTDKVTIGDPPAWLKPAGQALWHRLIANLATELRDVDRESIILACSHYAAAEDALRDLNERGPLVEGDRGMVKNPSNQVAREQSAAYRAWCAELGLTPRARKLLAMTDDEPEDDGLID